MRLRILVTGGTFDKEYDEIAGSLSFRETHLPEMLALGRCRLDLVVQTVVMVDSLQMTHAERELVVAACRECPEQHLVVTHGTDTMVQTAEAIARDVGHKTVVLTGAMVPYDFGSSDGLFNLGSALSFAQVLPPGVYVAMNGRSYAWNNVKKDRETGVFEPLR